MISFKRNQIEKNQKWKKSSHLNEYLQKEISSHGIKLSEEKCIKTKFKV